jgi:hypothetical protein
MKVGFRTSSNVCDRRETLVLSVIPAVTCIQTIVTFLLLLIG